MDTIPEAHNDEFANALTGLRIQAEAHGVDITDDNVRAFIVHTAEVQARSMAEVRWLRTLLGRADRG